MSTKRQRIVQYLELKKRIAGQDTAFKYDPLDSGCIRLFDLLPGNPGQALRGSMRQAARADKPTYLALSYLWTPYADKTPWRVVWTDTDAIYVRESLWEIIHALRDREKTTTWWIDALCIDQHNPEERTEQVRRMSWIYENAQSTHVWLHRAKMSGELHAGIRSVNKT